MYTFPSPVLARSAVKLNLVSVGSPEAMKVNTSDSSPHSGVSAGVSQPLLRTRLGFSRSRVRLSGTTSPQPLRAPSDAQEVTAGLRERRERAVRSQGRQRLQDSPDVAVPARGRCPGGGVPAPARRASGARRVPPPALTPRGNEMLMPGRGARRCPRP